MPCGSDFVVLRAGACMPAEPILLALSLEARGFSFQGDGDDLIVRPLSRLTNADRAGLRRWKRHILALLDYEAPKVS